MRCDLVSVHQVDQFWPLLAKGMAKSCERSGGGLVAGDVWRECRSGSAWLIVATDDETTIHGASVWYLQTGASGAWLRCMALYGTKMKAWKDDMRALARRIAADCGAVGLKSDGRRGMKAMYPTARVKHVYYEEAL